MGFSFSGAAPNQGIMFARLKPFDERKGDEHSAQAVVGRLCGRCSADPGRDRGRRSCRRRSTGLAAFGGFEFEVLDQTRRPTSTTSARRRRQLIGAGQPVAAGCAALFTHVHRQRSAAASSTSIASRRTASGMPLSEITERDADLPRLAVRERLRLQQPRVSRLRAGRPAVPRRTRRRCEQFYARTARGADGAARAASCTVRETTAPQVISHFNLFRSAKINGSAAPGRQLGPGAAGDGAIWPTQTLPQGMTLRVVGHVARGDQGRHASRSCIFGLALLLVYLTLAAQYESLVLPFIILLGVPLAVLGALSARSGCAGCRTTSTARSAWSC